MRALALLGMLVSTQALAVDPGDTVFVKSDVESARFLDDPTPGPTFDESARVTVLFRVGDRIRVFVGDKYGWVLDRQVTSEAPAGETPDFPPEIMEQIKAMQVDPED